MDVITAMVASWDPASIFLAAVAAFALTMAVLNVSPVDPERRRARRTRRKMRRETRRRMRQARRFARKNSR